MKANFIAGINKLNNNKTPGIDNISAEMVKYGPLTLFEAIKETLNEAFEKEIELELGEGILVSLQKPGKTKGPVTNLRPVILLPILRKILSNIVLRRIQPKVEQFLADSQAAYRTNRSTSDIVWAYKWIIAKTQTSQIKVYITGIDMSSAFDTIRREQLIGIVKKFLDEDEVRMIQLLLSNTTLDVRINNAETVPFSSNMGSPQGDALSGVLFDIYFEETLRKVRNFRQEMDGDDVEESGNRSPTFLPQEAIYADDADFLTTSEQEKNTITEKIGEILLRDNLKVNDSKTEQTEIFRGERNTEQRRTVKKLGSLLGDTADIQRRKQLSIASMNRLNLIWIRKDHISEKLRLNLYRTLVKPVLMYNSSTWGLTQKETKGLDAFHRQQLRQLIGKKYPNKISNQNLYKRCEERPISIDILKGRWRLFGHILRLSDETPAVKAMKFYFEGSGKRFRGRPRETLVTTLNKDITRARSMERSFPIPTIKSKEDFQQIRLKAQDRTAWRKISEIVCRAAEAETT